MSAPIAEVPLPAPRSAPRKPPRSLSAFVIIGLILGALGLVFYTPQFPEISVVAERALMAVLTVIFYIIPLLLLWRGLNWARWLVIGLIVSMVAILITGSFIPDDVDSVPTSPIEDFLYTISLFYDLVLIIFLLTPAMRRHFTGKPNGATKL